MAGCGGRVAIDRVGTFTAIVLVVLFPLLLPGGRAAHA